MPIKALFGLVFLAGIFPVLSLADDADYELGGHVKTRLLADAFPDDSVFNQLTGDTAVDLENAMRLNFSAVMGEWSFDTAYQLFAGYGDRIEYTRSLPADSDFFQNRLPNDARRLLNLTSVIEDDGKFAALHRLDRLWVGYTNDKTVVRLGRQAITWGNGLIFSPMDIVNPFDPTAIDTEYKSGDDMLYGQYLRDNGDDIQAAFVFRRDIVSGDPDADEGTAAVKYHGIVGDSEYDLLVARNYAETTLGIGGNRSIGGAVLRGDLVVADSSSGSKVQLVANLSHSWMWGGKNVSGVVEYYFTEYGLEDGNYELANLLQNTELLKRLARGESFTLGRHYIAGGVSIELTPLWVLTPNMFTNLEDGSALLQIVSRNNLSQNVEFLGALNVPLGPSGSEFGGIGSEMAGLYFSTDLSLFAQVAWYF
ncbi:MAG: hypothetical protein DRQ63_08540 [Gammaproteobacteria bacterium]|nr:MAG: hypothetical protein DRQ63_08540 [Gammaproteobacteria bacterium]